MRFLLLVSLISIFSSSALFATPKYLESFKKNYPDAAGTKLAACSTCHPVKGKMKEQGPFALDFKNAGHNFAKIADIDSDQDRFTNFEEIVAGTFPQDKTDKPNIPFLIKQIKELKQEVERLKTKVKE
ncbi:hypothetical protein A3H38_06665 [candidate division WOR-1 bacterium RIFCSPLOWO2_02_FULL_46_20]|uniref:Cytochrome c domain-containing protein n=2 Tax=Saganbacteria TaxID=1703751 RepID=A0A1F4RCF8_UNCSA|nr:MAG: hypothetical protein A3J44_04660 [candidate division WOR-1 bacterium RIFCSPHIGHO2_02_FULL_45_12]OGC05862.1 MAG: hypothetical protein A3H38_06665 [candidate division WOR-1 bacterium RIFCSPLOWO2_02_FULL_46_20]OGC09143.1 MAG: hypothetical protein A3F86_01565 [candidate division WOR-1 bacterium RIFCSPLOWO2_12_FULL_45_9]